VPEVSLGIPSIPKPSTSVPEDEKVRSSYSIMDLATMDFKHLEISSIDSAEVAPLVAVPVQHPSIFQPPSSVSEEEDATSLYSKDAALDDLKEPEVPSVKDVETPSHIAAPLHNPSTSGQPTSASEKGKVPNLYAMDTAVEALKERGIQLINEGKVYEGIECFTEAIQQAPQNPLLWCNRSHGYSALRPPRWKKSYDDANEAIKLDDCYWKAWSRRGLANLRMGKVQLALKDFAKAEKLFKHYFPGEKVSEALREGLEEARDWAQKLGISRYQYAWDNDNWPPPSGIRADVAYERPACPRGPGSRIGMSYRW
jgi:tetratricopeptide (TPR) repeat protein